MSRKPVKKKTAPKRKQPAAKPGEIIFQNDPRFADAMELHRHIRDAMTAPRTVIDRLDDAAVWSLRHADRIRFWFWLAAVAVASWILSSVYSGMVVADACRDVAAFELFGRVYACGLGQ